MGRQEDISQQADNRNGNKAQQNVPGLSRVAVAVLCWFKGSTNIC